MVGDEVRAGQLCIHKNMQNIVSRAIDNITQCTSH